MISPGTKLYSTVISFPVLRGMVYIALLIIYFIRISDQSKAREASFKNLLKRETGQGPYVQKINTLPADAVSTQALFRIKDKKGGGAQANSQ